MDLRRRDRLPTVGFLMALLLAPPAIEAQVFTGPEFRVNTFTMYGQRYPAVASGAAGNFVVVWQSYLQDGDARGVFGQRYAGGGAPLGAEFQVNTYTNNDQRYPSAGADPAGNFVVVWTSQGQDGSGYGIIGRRYSSAGTPLDGEFQVNTYTTNYQGEGVVAVDRSGNFVVVWTSYQQDGSSDGIVGRRFSSTGAPLAGEFVINTYTTNSQLLPAVAIDGAGNFVVVWRSYGQDGSGLGIFGQRYASTGAPLGGEFPVNTYTTGQQLEPTVAADGTGRFVVVWHSAGQDGDGYGVFGQRYASTGAPLGGEFTVNTYTPRAASTTPGCRATPWATSPWCGRAPRATATPRASACRTSPPAVPRSPAATSRSIPTRPTGSTLR
jgi:hypothetical protein